MARWLLIMPITGRLLADKTGLGTAGTWKRRVPRQKPERTPGIHLPEHVHRRFYLLVLRSGVMYVPGTTRYRPVDFSANESVHVTHANREGTTEKFLVYDSLAVFNQAFAQV